MPTVRLTEEQAEYLGDVLDWWLEDFEGATNDVVADQAHAEAEDMLVALSGMHHLFSMATEVKEILRGRASALPAL